MLSMFSYAAIRKSNPKSHCGADSPFIPDSRSALEKYLWDAMSMHYGGIRTRVFWFSPSELHSTGLRLYNLLMARVVISFIHLP